MFLSVFEVVSWHGLCHANRSADGATDAPKSDTSPTSTSQHHSSTLPRPPPRSNRNRRHSTDLSVSATPSDDPSSGDGETPASTRLESGDGQFGESSKTSATKTIPVAVVSPSNTGVLAPTNTRRIGSKFSIDLVKGLFLFECFLVMLADIFCRHYFEGNPSEPHSEKTLSEMNGNKWTCISKAYVT